MRAGRSDLEPNDAHIPKGPHTDRPAREDRSVPLPEPVPRVAAPLPLAASAMAVSPGPVHVFTLACPRIVASGSYANGIRNLTLHGICLLDQATVPGAVHVRSAATPLGFERAFRTGEDLLVLERLILLNDPPAAVLEWSLPEAPPERSVPIRFLWRTDLQPDPPRPAEPLHYHIAGPRLAVRAGPDGLWLGFSASDDAAVFHIEADATTALRCELRATVAHGRPVRLLVTARVHGEPSASTISLAALHHPLVPVRGREAALNRAARERLALVSPEPEVNRTLAWAAERLRAARAEIPGHGPSLLAHCKRNRADAAATIPGETLWTALGCLAAGEFDVARETLLCLAALQDDDGRIPGAVTTSGVPVHAAHADTPAFLLLAAATFAWTADQLLIESVLDRVRRALVFGANTGVKATDPVTAAMWAAACRELAHTAQSIGQVELLNELNRLQHAVRDALARNAAPASPEAGTAAALAIPLILADAPPAQSPAWLDRLEAGEFDAAAGLAVGPDDRLVPADTTGAVTRPLTDGWVAWAAWAAGRSAAFRCWRRTLDLAGVRGCAWPDAVPANEPGAPADCPDYPTAAALAHAALVYGLLGAAPDAARGRLRLRPQPPAQWDHFDVRNLRLTDASLSLRYQREGSRLAISVAQETGAVPLNLVLEPVPPAPFRKAWLNGDVASLDRRFWAGRPATAVQLMLDREHTLELE